MKKIVIDAQLTSERFLELRKAWDAADDAMLVISAEMPIAEAVSLFEQLCNYLPDRFSSLILSEIVENHKIPHDLLERHFDKADVGLQSTICLLPSLSEGLKSKCRTSRYPDVASHFKK